VIEVALAVIYVGIIFYTGLIRIGALPEVGLVPTDKLLHAVVFGGLVLLLVRALRVLWPLGSASQLLFASVGVASFLGAALEVCQSFVPYRSAEVLDWVADTVGAVLAAALLALLSRLMRRRAFD
jgi:VanZ family protein